MPLNEIPRYFNPETRHLVDAALEDAWQELKKDGLVDADPARMKLATTIVALASVGETDPGKLKGFALHGAQAAFKSHESKGQSGGVAQLSALDKDQERTDNSREIVSC
jgi:hypothetical protein